ncbi:MAG: hemerythrin domain-containing protein [Lautropia sp.]
MARFKIYQIPHKGLRQAIAQLVLQAGSTDYTDDAELAALRTATETLFSALDHHAHVEEQFILTELAKVDPAITAVDADAHRQLEQTQASAMALLDRMVLENRARRQVAQPALDAPDDTASAFYLTLTQYQAMQLRHMYAEETVTQPALLAAFTDAQIGAIDARIVAALNETVAPERIAQLLGGMLACAAPNERAQMLGRIRTGMPVDAFAQLLEPVTAPLNARDRAKLQLALA